METIPVWIAVGASVSVLIICMGHIHVDTSLDMHPVHWTGWGSAFVLKMCSLYCMGIEYSYRVSLSQCNLGRDWTTCFRWVMEQLLTVSDLCSYMSQIASNAFEGISPPVEFPVAYHSWDEEDGRQSFIPFLLKLMCTAQVIVRCISRLTASAKVT